MASSSLFVFFDVLTDGSKWDLHWTALDPKKILDDFPKATLAMRMKTFTALSCQYNVMIPAVRR